jgi:hypothetical protein
MPARRPLSTSAFLTHSFRVCAVQSAIRRLITSEFVAYHVQFGGVGDALDRSGKPLQMHLAGSSRRHAQEIVDAKTAQNYARLRFQLLPPCFPERRYSAGEAKSAPKGAS